MKKYEKLIFWLAILIGFLTCGFRLHQIGGDIGILYNGVSELNDKVIAYEEIIVPKATKEPTGTLECIGEYRCSHYCSCVQCCGKSNGITASGTIATAGRTIAMEGLEMGTVVYIEAIDEYRVVEDRFGNPSKTDCADIFVEDHNEALQNGVYTSKIYVLKGE